MHTVQHPLVSRWRSLGLALMLVSASNAVCAATATVPNAPSSVTVTAGSAQLSIAFTAPTAVTGTSITGYTASCTLSGSSVPVTATATQSPITVTGLSSGSYSCTVVTNYTSYTSASSSVATTPVSTSVAPSVYGVLPGDSRISVMYNFIGGKILGSGSASDTYTATCTSSNGGVSGTSTSSAEYSSGSGTLPKANYTNPLVVSGLTNGKTYTCTVTASLGTSTATSTASAAVIPNAGPSNASGVLSSTVNSTFNTTFSSYASYCNYTTASATTAGAGAVPTLSVYPTTATTSSASKSSLSSSSTVTCSGTSTRTIAGNALPDHRSAEFFTNGLSGYTGSPYFSGNPNAIGAKTVSKTVPYTGTQKGTYTQGSSGYSTTACYTYTQTVGSTPTAATNCTYVSYPAYLNNSVKVEPGTAETYVSTSGVKTTYKVVGKNLYQDVGLDPSNAHNQPTTSGTSTLMWGYYHYHGVPEGYVARLGKGNSTMTLVGFAVDGYPIYARYGYTNRTTTTGGVKIMKSNYRLRTAQELSTAGYTDRPSTSLAPYGTFEQDWVFDATAGGDLDACNGRWGVTPESPSTSVYHYYITDSYPFVQRCVFGTLLTNTWANDAAQN